MGAYFALLTVWCTAACGDDALIVLGDRTPPTYRFDPPEMIRELAAPAKTDNPSLTADLLQIYFTSERGGPPADIWFAERSRREDRFGVPKLVRELSSPATETSVALSADGLSVWLGSDRAGGRGDLDIWVSTRKRRDAVWSQPTNLGVLDSDGKDIPRPLGQHQRVMPLSSDRDTPDYYQIYFAERADDTQPFARPELVSELVRPNTSTVDGCLTDDGLTLFYVRGPAFGPADIYVASRRTQADAFGDEVALDDLNTPNDERDPWLSPDGSEFYFSSDRSGNYAIYVASVR